MFVSVSPDAITTSHLALSQSVAALCVDHLRLHRDLALERTYTPHSFSFFYLTPHLYLRHPVCSVTCRSLGPKIKSAPFTRWCGALERSRIDRCLFHAIHAFEFDRLSDLLGQTRSPRAYSPGLHPPCQQAHPLPDPPLTSANYPSHMAERMRSLGH
jgi:hypothetical protein